MVTDRIEFKEGVQWKRSHSLWAMQRILEVALITAPETEDGRVVVTELWRRSGPPRDGLDLHDLCLAADFRIHNILVPNAGDYPPEGLFFARVREAWSWVARMRQEHDDPRFQFSVHGSDPQDLRDPTMHLHAEFDPR